MSTRSIIELEQGVAINHSGSHARLLAGPGTGKTRVLTDRVLHLISSENIQPETILVLTFTRAAASELRGRIRAGLSDEVKPPNISTLHSFALRQLLKNSDKIDSFPRPLRIASDWDEDTVIVEDLKVAMNITKKEIEDKEFRDWRDFPIRVESVQQDCFVLDR